MVKLMGEKGGIGERAWEGTYKMSCLYPSQWSAMMEISEFKVVPMLVKDV